MSFWTVGAAVVAAGATIYNQNQVASKQDAATAAGLRQQGQLQTQANQDTNKLINQFQTSTQKPYQQQAMGKFMQAVQANSGNATQPLNQVGNTSDAYKQAAKDAANGISTYGSTNAGLMSQMDAPQMQRQALTGDQLAYGSELGQIDQQSRTDQFLAQLKAGSVQPNPWISGIAAGLSAYSRSGGMGAKNPGGAVDTSGGTGVMAAPGGYYVNMPTY